MTPRSIFLLPCCFSRNWTCILRLMRSLLHHWAIKHFYFLLWSRRFSPSLHNSEAKDILFPIKSICFAVVLAGLEPTTFDVSDRCSTNWAIRQWGQKQNRTVIKLVLQTNTETNIGYLSLWAKYQNRTASPVWKTGALPLSYISH